MRSRFLVLTLLVAAALALAVVGAFDHFDAAEASTRLTSSGRYIVTLRPKPGVSAQEAVDKKVRPLKIRPRHVYGSALRGFSVDLTSDQLTRLSADPEVLAIVPDRPVHAFAQTVPTGIKRSQADRNAAAQIGSGANPISVDVAVIDTGIDVDHPDLNVGGGVNCVPGESSYDDQNGHGTHVGGTIGARDDGSGVVGVAPGARLWAVRVLNANGEGEFSDVICGIDWVTAHAGTIEVANMSLGGEAPVEDCNDHGLHEAICASVNAGVTYVVAAGNSSLDAGGFVPAAYPEVITVSAIVDTDGKPSGKGPTSFVYGDDDTLATFSNYGSVVDIAAPGLNILSTWPGGGTALESGTSMASPHVAGAAAVYLYEEPGVSPDAVRTYLRSIAWAQDSTDGFTGDVDGSAEPLINAGAVGGDPLPPPPPACTSSASSGVVGSSVTVSCFNFDTPETVRIYLDSTSTTQRGSMTIGSSGAGSLVVKIPDATGGAHTLIAQGGTTGTQIALPFMVVPNLQLNTTTGKVGSTLSATFTGFGGTETVNLSWDGANYFSNTTSAVGRVTFFTSVPQGTKGLHTIAGTGVMSGLTKSAGYTVQTGITLSPTAGKVGSNVTAALGGYVTGEQVIVRWYDTASSSTVLQTVVTSSAGGGSATFAVPSASKGAHTVDGAGNQGSLASASYTVNPSVAGSPLSGKVGATVTLTLKGYGPNDSIALRWYDTSTTFTVLKTVTPSATGDATTSIVAPDAANGSHRIEAVGTSGAAGSAFFSISGAIAIDPTRSPAGTTITAMLTGYRASESIEIRWYATSSSAVVLTTIAASLTGSGTETVTVPADATAGDHKVEGRGLSSFASSSTTFTVGDAGPPPPPPPPSCTIGPSTGVVSSSVSVACTSLTAYETVRVYWDSDNTTAKAMFSIGSNGSGSSSFTVSDADGGAHSVLFTGTVSGSLPAKTFTVTPNLKLISTSGKVGTFLSATVTGFGANETVEIRFDGPAIASGLTSALGKATISISIPEGASGAHTLSGVGLTSALSATASFTVTPSLALSLGISTVGSAVTATGKGYAAGEAVNFLWLEGANSTVVTSSTAGGNGTATATFQVPEASKGAHTITGSGSSGNLASATFTVSGSMTDVPPATTVGAPLTATAHGFAAGETITFRWYDTTTDVTVLSSIPASAIGNATLNVPTPAAYKGSHQIEVIGSTSGAKIGKFVTVNQSLALDPTSGPAGTTVTVSLTGYGKNEVVTVKWFVTTSSSASVATIAVSAVGSGTGSFVVPAGATQADHKVEGTGGSTFGKASALFAVSAMASLDTPTTASVRNVAFDDDFSGPPSGGLPPGWTREAASSDRIAIETAERRGDAFVEFATDGGEGVAWLSRDGHTYDRAVVETDIRFTGDGGRGGVVLAWNGPDNYVTVVADVDADTLELSEVAGGTVVDRFITADGDLSFKPGSTYTLRVVTGHDGDNAWATLYWGNAGSHLKAIATITGIEQLDGSVGLTMFSGETAASIGFDNFHAEHSDSTKPVEIERGSRATVTPTPPPTEAPEATPTLEPEPTETATPTPAQEPAATQTPVAEPTAAPTEPPPAEASPTD
ncbi:MAG: S8 family serine peptidase [Thermomicrobiales bacterium]